MKKDRHCKDCGTLLYKHNQADLYLCKDCASTRQLFWRTRDKPDSYIEDHLLKAQKLVKAYKKVLKYRVMEREKDL